MKRMSLVSLICLAAAGALLAVAAIGADPPTTQPAQPSMQNACPVCVMMETAAGEMNEEMKQMMKDAGITQQMMMRPQMIMHARMYMNGPAVLLGMSKSLGLTEEQQKKLMDIEKKARDEAVAVLTEEQQKKLGRAPDEPVTMMEGMWQMHQRMRPMMEKMHAEGKKLPTECPMMMRTMRGESRPGMGGTMMRGRGMMQGRQE